MEDNLGEENEKGRRVPFSSDTWYERRKEKQKSSILFGLEMQGKGKENEINFYTFIMIMVNQVNNIHQKNLSNLVEINIKVF